MPRRHFAIRSIWLGMRKNGATIVTGSRSIIISRYRKRGDIGRYLLRRWRNKTHSGWRGRYHASKSRAARYRRAVRHT